MKFCEKCGKKFLEKEYKYCSACRQSEIAKLRKKEGYGFRYNYITEVRSWK